MRPVSACLCVAAVVRTGTSLLMLKQSSLLWVGHCWPCQAAATWCEEEKEKWGMCSHVLLLTNIYTYTLPSSYRYNPK